MPLLGNNQVRHGTDNYTNDCVQELGDERVSVEVQSDDQSLPCDHVKEVNAATSQIKRSMFGCEDEDENSLPNVDNVPDSEIVSELLQLQRDVQVSNPWVYAKLTASNRLENHALRSSPRSQVQSELGRSWRAPLPSPPLSSDPTAQDNGADGMPHANARGITDQVQRTTVERFARVAENSRSSSRANKENHVRSYNVLTKPFRIPNGRKSVKSCDVNEHIIRSGQEPPVRNDIRRYLHDNHAQLSRPSQEQEKCCTECSTTNTNNSSPSELASQRPSLSSSISLVSQARISDGCSEPDIEVDAQGALEYFHQNQLNEQSTAEWAISDRITARPLRPTSSEQLVLRLSERIQPKSGIQNVVLMSLVSITDIQELMQALNPNVGTPRGSQSQVMHAGSLVALTRQMSSQWSSVVSRALKRKHVGAVSCARLTEVIRQGLIMAKEMVPSVGE
jgi:hypothetical protein